MEWDGFYYLETNTYDANNNQLSNLNQSWNGGWVNSILYLYTYDANNNQLSNTCEEWYILNWANYSIITSTYDGNNIMLSYAEKDYNFTGTQVATGDSIYWYFNGTVTGINNIANNGSTYIFPNPNNGSFTLSLTNINEKCTIEIYNVLGKKIYFATLNQVQGDNTINLISQPNGIYIYRVLAENGELIGEGKVVIQK